MNKAQIIDSISNLSGLTKKASGEALEAAITSIENALKNGEKVILVGFGNWEVVDRAERNGINPKTLAPLVIPATKAVKFKAGKDLKAKVANA